MKLIFAILLSINIPAFSQDSLLYDIFPVVDKKVIYEKIIDAPGQSKDTLFMKAKVWALSAFRSQKAAFQTEDRTGGLLAYETFFTNDFQTPTILGVSMNQDWQYWSQVRIYLKDGKAKVVIENENIKISHVSDHRYDAEYNIFTFKSNLDNVYKNTAKRYRERYWVGSLENFKLANEKYKSIITSFEQALNSIKKAESDF